MMILLIAMEWNCTNNNNNNKL